MEEATTIIGRGNTALRLWTQDRDEVNRLIEDYTDAIARLKRYAGDAQLSYAMFLSMADSIARTI